MTAEVGEVGALRPSRLPRASGDPGEEIEAARAVRAVAPGSRLRGEGGEWEAEAFPTRLALLGTLRARGGKFLWRQLAHSVMAGPDPAIHAVAAPRMRAAPGGVRRHGMDHPVKPGDDGGR
jgi:hypothetical protein